MLAQAISHKLHSLYSYAIVQYQFMEKEKFESAIKYMEKAYGTGIYHDRSNLHNGYKRNTGDNSVWYYTDVTVSRYGHRSACYKIYITTPEQLTMIGLFFS